MADDVVSPPSDARTGIDTTVAHSARIWNYWLGGKDNYPIDRQVGAQVLELFPGLVHSARADRRFLARLVRLLAGERGIRQFLDIGTGLPTADNTHQVAQRIAPSSRIVYVDNDPLVLQHAEALLVSSPEGATDYIQADVNDPGAIVSAAARTLDFSKPVAIMLLGILNFVVDTERARAITHALVEAVVPGSFLVISHPTAEVDTEAITRALAVWNEQGSATLVLRSPAELRSFFDQAELLEPGVVTCPQWRPEPGDDPTPLSQFAGVGVKR